MKKEFKIGDTVKVLKNIDINGIPIEQYDATYVITKIKGNEIELSSKRNNMLYKWAVVKSNNIKKVEE